MPTLDWLNREQALAIADAVPYRLLEHLSSHGDPTAGNRLIQSDEQREDVSAQIDHVAGAA